MSGFETITNLDGLIECLNVRGLMEVPIHQWSREDINEVANTILASYYRPAPPPNPEEFQKIMEERENARLKQSNKDTPEEPEGNASSNPAPYRQGYFEDPPF